LGRCGHKAGGYKQIVGNRMPRIFVIAVAMLLYEVIV
jgi:hypothetical protein